MKFKIEFDNKRFKMLCDVFRGGIVDFFIFVIYSMCFLFLIGSFFYSVNVVYDLYVIAGIDPDLSIVISTISVGFFCTLLCYVISCFRIRKL